MNNLHSRSPYVWERAPFLRLLLPLIAAIVCYDQEWLPHIHRNTILFSMIIALAATVAVCAYNIRFSLYGYLRSLVLFSTIFLAGWLCCQLNDHRYQKSWFGQYIDGASGFQVKLDEDPSERTKTWKLAVSVENVYSSDGVHPVTGKALLYLYKDSTGCSLRKGNKILVPNKWKAIENSGNPAAFDYQRFCNRNQIYYLQFLSCGEIVQLPFAKASQTWVDATHDWAMQALEKYIKDTPTLGLMQAMLLGEEDNFDADMRQAYAETGIIHVVAISGGHVMMLFWLIGGLFFWLRHKRYEFIKYLVAVPCVCFYVAVAGAPVSAVRAAVMFSFLASGYVLQKEREPINQLCVTAFFMLLYQPMWLLSVGFQLSFGAVLSLILFYQPILRLYAPTSFGLRKLWSVAAASIAAEVIVAPLVIYYFHLFPIGFLFANILAWLLMGLVLCAGLLLIAVSTLAPLASLLAIGMTEVVHFFNLIIEVLQNINPPAFSHLYLSGACLSLIYFIIACCSGLIPLRKQWVVPTILSTFCLILILLILRRWQTLQQQQLIVYNLRPNAYAELIAGERYYPVLNQTKIDPEKDFSTKAAHIQNAAWRKAEGKASGIFLHRGRSILILEEPPSPDTSLQLKVNYLIASFPLKHYHAPLLKRQFNFDKLIITGGQKTYIARQWKDSCERQNIPAHFTMFDGAFVLR